MKTIITIISLTSIFALNLKAQHVINLYAYKIPISKVTSLKESFGSGMCRNLIVPMLEFILKMHIYPKGAHGSTSVIKNGGSRYCNR